MTVKQRIANRHQFKSDAFRIHDPEHGVIVANVNEFQNLPADSPVWGYQVVEEEKTK